MRTKVIINGANQYFFLIFKNIHLLVEKMAPLGRKVGTPTFGQIPGFGNGK